MLPTHTSVFCFKEQLSSCVLSHQEPCSCPEDCRVPGGAHWRLMLFGAELVGQVFSWCKSAALYQLQQLFRASENLDYQA